MMDQFEQEAICTDVDFEFICDKIREHSGIHFNFFYNNRVEYGVLICALEVLGYKWNSGSRPSDWQPPLPFINSGSLAIKPDKHFACGIKVKPDNEFYLQVSDFVLKDDSFDVASDDEFESMLHGDMR